MTYIDGTTVRIGDHVNLGGKQPGVIVGIITEGKYADGYKKEDWDYLGSGLIVNTDFGDLRLEEPDEDLEFAGESQRQVRFR